LAIAAIEAVLLVLLIWSSMGYLRNSNEDELIKRAQTVVHLFGTTTRDAVLATDLAMLIDDALTLLTENKNGLARVTKIVRDLRDFASVGESEWQAYDLRLGIESTLNLMHGRLSNAELIKEYGAIPKIECLPSEINRVFMNLLLNAAQAILGQGQIVVTAEVQGGGVCVSIRDSGCGIPAENINPVFAPFFTAKPVGQGTGLRLSLCYGIVQQHHGHIEFDSPVGKGATFSVWLPVSQPETT